MKIRLHSYDDLSLKKNLMRVIRSINEEKMGIIH